MLTDEQLKLRLMGVTGSEIASVAGLNPYEGPFEVYCKKKGAAQSNVDTHHTLRGKFLEPSLIAWYEHKTSRCVLDANVTRVHREYPIIIATPDGVSNKGSDERALEIKSPSWRGASQWGEEGTDEIPQHYIPQVMWECAVLGVRMADVAALIDGDLKIYHVPFDVELFHALREIAERFWRDHVIADKPPAPSGSERARDMLVQIYPRAEKKLIEPTEDLIAHAQSYLAASATEKTAKKDKEHYGNLLRSGIADAEGFEHHSCKATWKQNKDSKKIDYEALIKELNPPKELIEKYTKIIPGARVLRVSAKGESNE